jgi:heme/copper-type cytochrome/quinol oxidase subunit 3
METSRTKLGVVMLIVSEAIFFLLLILAYVYFHAYPDGGPSAADSLNPARTAVFSLFLIASSATVWFAGRRAAREGMLGPAPWIAATIALGLVFIAGQGAEWADLIAAGVTVNRNLFGTTFFTLTGFHGLHVLLGIVALAALAGLVAAGRLRGRAAQPIEAVSLYWHFVDAVWIVIFSVVYLGARV